MLAVAAARPQTRANTSWNVYTVKGERLSMVLPVFPGMETSKEARTKPQKDRRRRVIKCSTKDVVYTIHIVENPKPRLTLESFIQEQATANPEDKLTFEGDVSLDGIAGKAFSYPDKKGVVQFFATEDRLYDVRAYGAPVNDPRIATFFRSLTLKKKEGAIEVTDNVQDGVFDATETLYTGEEVETKPRLVKKPDPTYTEEARGAQITGTVILRCIFAADGTVRNIRLVSGLPYGLTEKAIEAARKIKFIPATKDGKNVSMWMQLEYNFNLYR